MSDQQDFKKALLEQNGLQAGHLPEPRRKEIEMMLERDLKRVQRMRWVTGFLWVLWGMLYVIFGFAGMEPRRIESVWGIVLFLVWMALFPTAIVCSISLYIRWRSVGLRHLDARLARLEEKLNSLSGRE